MEPHKYVVNLDYAQLYPNTMRKINLMAMDRLIKIRKILKTINT